MLNGMEVEPGAAIGWCRDAHERLLRTIDSVEDRTARRPSLLPGWTVGHVLTHMARNADGHSLRLEGALQGKEVARYPGGPEQRNRDIQAGAGRPAAELIRDVAESNQRLERIWAMCEQAGWPNAQLMGDDRWPTTGSPIRRFREVEVHHVDLNLGYEPTDWPEEYVQWELPLALDTVPRRLKDAGDSRRLLAWLIGRRPSAGDIDLGPWL
jgi:maleylpyruvate isomerase